ncbi:MAG TPA: hypothetical protein VK419_05900 [Bryobacteraceae bacterium]|nr:hypothetical protein [Bryobacteraceae bacterium]
MTSGEMCDEQFARAFERYEIPKEEFHHRDHVRLARYYVRRYGAHDAEPRIASAIRRYAEHLGVSEKYHHTITIAWMRLVAHAPSSDALLDPEYLNEFYSAELLATPAARNIFVAPDKKPLPGDAQAAPDVVK